MPPEIVQFLLELLRLIITIVAELLLYAADFGLQFILLITFVALVGLFLAPFETVRWWVRQQENTSATAEQIPQQVQGVEQFQHALVQSRADAVLVYLSGIGDPSGDYEAPNEVLFLDQLQARLPTTLIIRDVFAFSVTKRGLEKSTALGHVWSWLNEQKSSRSRTAVLGQIINLRNLMQVLVSADYRYGPIYSYGIAEIIVRFMLQRGYQLGSGVPVILLGYSGGGQVALGAARYIASTVRAPVWVISMGGVLSSDPGLNYIHKLYHVYGERDNVHTLGERVFPGRWFISRKSFWNIAKREGRIIMMNIGPIGHNGPNGYLDANATLPDGTRFLEKTLDTIETLANAMRAEAHAATSPSAA